LRSENRNPNEIRNAKAAAENAKNAKERERTDMKIDAPTLEPERGLQAASARERSPAMEWANALLTHTLKRRSPREMNGPRHRITATEFISRGKRRAPLIALLAVLLAFSARAEFQYQLLKSFNGGDGRGPVSGLLEASDGALYGVTPNGGTDGLGTVYRINKDGSAHTVLHNFSTNSFDGRGPVGRLIEASDGMLYGTSIGAVFRINKDGSDFVILGGSMWTRAGLMEGSDGALYGTGFGYAFKLNKDGSGFNATLTCANDIPESELIEGGDGMIYHVNSGSACGSGAEGDCHEVLRAIMLNQSFSVKKRAWIGTCSPEPVNPTGGLMEASDGHLFGVGYYYGTLGKTGVVYSLDKATFSLPPIPHIPHAIIRVLATFPPAQGYPVGKLLEGRDGRLYGARGATVFRLNKDGSGLEDVATVDGTIAGLTLGSDGRTIYGTTTDGGESGYGTIFKLSGLPLIHYVDVNSTNPAPPYTNWATAANVIQDAVDVAEPGDTILVTNGVYASGERDSNRVMVDKPIAVQSVNGPEVTIIQGLKISTNRNAGLRCMYLASGASLNGFTLTNGAARYSENVDPPGYVGGGVFCEDTNASVSNCILIGNSGFFSDGGSQARGGGAWGGTLNNCKLIQNTAGRGGGAAWSTLNDCLLYRNIANDPFLENDGIGGGAVNCLLNNCTVATNNALLFGGGASGCELRNCTVIGNRADAYGGGLSWCTINNSVLTANFGWYSAGGAAYSTLNNCLVVSNRMAPGSLSRGGGVYGCELNNCTLAGNLGNAEVLPPWLWSGGGADSSQLTNCILYQNSPLNARDCTLNYCSVFPGVIHSGGNITNEPVFVDVASGNFRLSSNSPCINAGNNAYAPPGPALDGNPRIAGGTVDIGAYEFQSPASHLSYAWLQQHGFPMDGSADFSDPDGDNFNNWQEWRAGTSPLNAESLLRMLSVSHSLSGAVVTWQSVVDRTYFIERATNLAQTPSFTILRRGLAGLTNTTSFTDTNAIGAGPFFYRVGVEE
jgi:uncharacterized repeat protein (TIGR03803 family)